MRTTKALITVSGWTNWEIKELLVARGWEVASDIHLSPVHVCRPQHLTPSHSNVRCNRKCLLIDRQLRGLCLTSPPLLHQEGPPTSIAKQR